MPKELKAIIFDNEWVLVKNDWEAASRIAARTHNIPNLQGYNLKKALQIPCVFGGRRSNLLAEYGAGRIDGNLLWNRFLKSVNAPQTEFNREIMREALRVLASKVDEDALDLVKRLRETRNYRLLMLSNTVPEVTEGNKDRNGNYYSLFHKCYISHDIGFRKPEREAYEYVLKDQYLRGRDCMMVDDKPENLEPARRLGMQTLLHKIGDGKLSSKLAYLLENGS
jgi:putative hydrolase of the HAD superfamily